MTALPTPSAWSGGRSTPARRILTGLVAIALIAAACTGGDDDSADTVDVSSAGADDTETTATSAGDTATDTSDGGTADGDTDGDGGDGDGDGDGDETTTTTGDESTTTELAGEEFDGFPQDGDVLAVIGVAHDDELNVRAGPGTDQGILTFASPLADDLVATGRARLLPSSIWYEVEFGGQVGWVSSSFVGFKGGTTDDTANYLGGDSPPAFETMVELGEFVAGSYASEDPPSRIVQSVAPENNDGLADITYDVVGIGDDAGLGFRVHVFATEDDNGETLSLRTIELTTFCTRGLAGEACR